MKKTGLALGLAVCLMTTAALADSISFSGKVEESSSEIVYAPVTAVVESIPVQAGQTVTADTVIATLKTTKVYAPEDGTVTSVFGQPGNSVENVTSRYGGVVYLEGPYTLQVSTSTSKAYEDEANYIVHSGETVYVVSRSHTSTKGKGIITTVDGSNYTVLITEGNFLMGDSVNICRESNYSLMSSLGRGTISRVSPTAISGSGSIVSFAVQPGDTVTRGQLLFETVEGTFDGLEMTGTEIKAGVDGVISALNVSQGSTVNKDSIVAEIFSRDAVRVVAEVAETDLKDIYVGQKVKVELDWNQDLDVSYDGTIEMISAVATTKTTTTNDTTSSDDDSATYKTYVSFTPDENTRFGMTAVVTTQEGHTPSAAVEDPGEPEAEATEPGAESGD